MCARYGDARVDRRLRACAAMTRTSSIAIVVLLVAACSGQISQPGSVTPQSLSGTFALHVVSSGRCVDITSWSTANGTQLEQWDCSGNTNQQWTLTPQANGTVQVRSVFNGKCLDVRGFSTTDGAAIQQWDCSGNSNQQWTLSDDGGGRYELISASDGKCLDVTGENTANGALLQQWGCWGGGNQRFVLAPTSAWTLTWSDEFDGGAGSPVDGSKWGYDTGGGGWGNNELEYYTARTDNAALDGNGNLAIVARAESYGGRGYTSARINTGGKFFQAYGRIEARIKLPSGRGLWPAFWTLGENIGSVGWPSCGELDIMENIGSEPSINHGSAHGPGYSGGNPLTATYALPQGRFSDGFHVFAIEWQPNQVRWYVDDALYETRTPADLPPGTHWVYDHPFFVILNVAVGGNFPGSPDGSTQFPQTMLVDYVRVFSAK
jgi:beta-glucanase (GH16 family)